MAGRFVVTVAVVLEAGALSPAGAPVFAQSGSGSPLPASSGATERSWPDVLWDHVLHSPRLLDDPWNARSWLEDRGLTLSFYFNHQYGVNTRGGTNTEGAQRHSGSLDSFALLETGRAGLWTGGELLFHAKSNYNENINPDVGALANPIDDADFDEALWIDQFWYQQQALEGRVMVRAGYLDLQGIIDRNAYANNEDVQFMNTFLDNNGAIIPLKVGFGSALWVRPAAWLEFIAGVSDAEGEVRQAGFDTAFDDFESLVVFGQAGLAAELSSARGPLPGKYRFGTFYDPRSRPVFGRSDPVTGEPRLDKGDVGWYLSFDQLVFREGGGGEQGLGLFARYGYRDEDVYPVAHFWSAGLQYLGLLPARDDDALGIGFYQTIASDRYRDEVDREFSRETALEIYYRIQATPWFAVTPGYQFIDDPGALKSARDAHVLVLRFRAAF